jgi:hypothetical protein
LGRFYPILGTSVESPIILKGNPVKIKVEEISETGAVVNTPTRAFVAFATPFGETFITHAGSGYGCPTLETDMHWQESSKPTKEFEAVGGSTGSDKVISTKSDGNHKLRITFTKSGSTKVLYVNTNGDAYIE